MAYPGEGYKMSNYGHKTYTPEQMKEQWRESVERETKTCKFHPSTKRAAETQPIDLTQTHNYFNTHKSHQQISTYDRTFCVEEGYCSRLKRDDRQNTQALNVHAEEAARNVPVLASSVYGCRPPLETPDRLYVRVGLVKREFYRPCGTNMTPHP